MLDLDPGIKISSKEYGPFDNGYLLLGLSNGRLLGLQFPRLEIVLNQVIYEDESSIDHISIELSNMVIVGSK